MNRDLECSAVISAADQLIVKKKVPPDDLIRKMGYGASMLYLTRYAVPRGLKEREAFAQVKALRARLLAELSPQDIVAKARECIAKAKM